MQREGRTHSHMSKHQVGAIVLIIARRRNGKREKIILMPRPPRRVGEEVKLAAPRHSVLGERNSDEGFCLA